MVIGLTGNKRDVRFWDTDMLNWGSPIIKYDYEPCSIALFFYALVAGGDGHSSVWDLIRLTDPDLLLQGLIDNAVSTFRY